MCGSRPRRLRHPERKHTQRPCWRSKARGRDAPKIHFADTKPNAESRSWSGCSANTWKSPRWSGDITTNGGGVVFVESLAIRTSAHRLSSCAAVSKLLHLATKGFLHQCLEIWYK